MAVAASCLSRSISKDSTMEEGQATTEYLQRHPTDGHEQCGIGHDVQSNDALSTEEPNPAESTSRKRTRGKYTSRACIQCRHRKLKCDGLEPCHRCARRSHQCVYSDDRAINEVLRQTRKQLVSGRVDGSVPLEARVHMLEVAMQSVTERLDDDQQARHGHDMAVESEHDLEQTEQADSFQGDTAFRSPVNTFHESLGQIKQSMGLSNDFNTAAISPRSMRASRPSGNPLSLRREQSFSQLRIGTKCVPFPSAPDYKHYLDYIFDDVNVCHPCLNEGDFRARSARMLGMSPLDGRESCFLALHLILFACADILREVSEPDDSRPSPASKWYQAADDLVGKSKFHGLGDLSLIQFLIFEAFYLTHDDRPNAAYNIAGLACRLCYQFGLHQQSRWDENESSYNTHMKQRILWTTYFVDRRIALSCGRPFGMNDSDIAVQFPSYIDDKELRSDAPLPRPNLETSFLPYMACMVSFARFSGEIWEKVFSASASNADALNEEIAVLDTRISHWASHILPSIPLLPPSDQPTVRHIRQHILVHTRVAHLRLLLRRRLMVSLTYSAQDGRLCGDLAMEIVSMISQRRSEAAEASSFRFHMAVSLSGALLILGTLLCRRLSELGLQDNYPAYAESFRQGLALLRELGTGLFAARRVLDDLKETISFVTTLIDQPAPTPQQPLMRMPSNIEQMFPYGAVDFNQQSGAGCSNESMQINGMRQPVGYTEAANGWNGLDDDASGQHSQGSGYGVPWI